MYRLSTLSTLVEKISDDGVITQIPADSGNSDWAEYQAWLASGNMPEPVPADTTWWNASWTQFRELRDVYLYRLEGIAGRAYRSGDAAFASAIDVFIQGILDIPQHPTTQPDVATTPAKLAKAVNALFSTLKNQAVGYDPATATTAYPDRKAIIDKVFK